MNDKLTPRQNEIISEALAQIATKAAEQGRDEDLPERIKTIRRALANEFASLSHETNFDLWRSISPSTHG
jgi:hypothetical protein